MDSLMESILALLFKYNTEAYCLAYKKVANKVHPVPATMPEGFCIICQFPEDPLATLPNVPTQPKSFTPGKRLTRERLKALRLFSNEFLWEEEKMLIAQVLLKNKMGLAWDKTEKGCFQEDYFEPVKIPVVEHIPWAKKLLPVPPGIHDKVIELIKQKVETGVYEPSYSSY
ncbi:hypothetical protein AN958_04007 [Leucoagaricus sp. SymC.cos]|nr:hypothetical protein AN958_04007 [Leucoagaricus sp. SymC.cos]